MPGVLHFRQTSSVGVSFSLMSLAYFVKLGQVVLELVVELVQRIGPLELAFLDLVQLFFHPRGVGFVEEIVKPAFDQNIVDGLAQRGRMKAAFASSRRTRDPESSS